MASAKPTPSNDLTALSMPARPARNRHRTGQGWASTAVQAVGPSPLHRSAGLEHVKSGIVSGQLGMPASTGLSGRRGESGVDPFGVAVFEAPGGQPAMV
jgi:hypothetical protein